MAAIKGKEGTIEKIIKDVIKKEKRKTPSERKRGRKRVERIAARSFRDKILARAKLFGYKTKLQTLMRKYNKLQKNWKGKAEYPKIDYLTLKANRFKMTKSNINKLMSQLEGSISKMEGAMNYPKELLQSMLEGCLMNAYKNEIDSAITERMDALLNDPRFIDACEDGAKAQTIYDLLVMIYDTISVGDESDIADVVSQLYDLL